MRFRLSSATIPGAILVLGSIWLAFSPSPTCAYPQYSDGTATANCAQCHEAAPGGFLNRGPLHDAHNANATSTCLLCHTQAGDIPQLASSGDPNGHGCIGCHGQVIGGVTTGAGLRAHHVAKGVVDGDGLRCSDCHSDPPAAPESSSPPYYGRSDVVQTNTCNTDGKEDFWNRTTGLPDGNGLDNDGDLATDVHDSDCAASYEVKNDGFKDPTNRNRYSWNAQLPSGQLFDVIRSDGALFPAASPNTLCLVNDASSLFVDDTVGVPLGKGFYYLVRNRLVNDYGKRSDGTLRTYTICP
jgi:hypothetical protein